MNMLVISVMSEEKISDDKVERINEIIKNVYNGVSLNNKHYKYENDKYFNLDGSV